MDLCTCVGEILGVVVGNMSAALSAALVLCMSTTVATAFSVNSSDTEAFGIGAADHEAIWQLGTGVLPADVTLASFSPAQAQTTGGGVADRAVKVSGPVLFIGTGILLLGWVGWRRSHRV